MVGSSQKDIDDFVMRTTNGMALISQCIRNVIKTYFDETTTPMLMFFSGEALLIKIPENSNLDADKLYNFRVLVENPKETFDNVNDRQRWWTIETRNRGKPYDYRPRIEEASSGDKRPRLDLKYDIPSFPVYPRIQLFMLQTLNQVLLWSKHTGRIG